MCRVDPLVGPGLADGTADPDRLHWSWAADDLVGRALARTLAVVGTDTVP